MRGVFFLIVILPLSLLAACAEGADEAPEAGELMEPTALAALWQRLVPEPPAREPAPGEVVARDGSATVVVHRMPLDSPAHDNGAHLTGIELPENATKPQVREYVAAVLRAAASMERNMWSTRDPEIEKLAEVGTEHADILLEPLVHLDRIGPDVHLLGALERVAGAEHKALVLAALLENHRLLDVVTTHDWTEAAAPILVRVLGERSEHLDPDWVVAAAAVAGPDHYDDLRFHLVRGQGHLRVWQAIRDLPGMEPLDDLVGTAWEATPRRPAFDRWNRLAVVAAHYGHMDALEAFARWLPRRRRLWPHFHTLTGYGHKQADRRTLEGASAWLETHGKDLVFDREARRYVKR